MLPNLYVILAVVALFLVSIAGTGTLMYMRGRDDMKAAYTGQQLTIANANLKKSQEQATRAAQAGADHDAQVQVVHDTTKEIIRTVTIPAASDPFLPVGFVRLWNRSASRNSGGDPYPGKLDGDPSDVKVSEAGRLLAGEGGWADDYYACRTQIADIVALKPVLPSAPVPQPSFLDRINPF